MALHEDVVAGAMELVAGDGGEGRQFLGGQGRPTVA
jgi:hypothetical protein